MKVSLKKIGRFVISHSMWIVFACIVVYIATHSLRIARLLQNGEFNWSDINADAAMEAVVFFLIILQGFKWLQNFLKNTALAKSSLDKGVRYSIIMLLHYLGWIIATWGGLSILGVDMGQLAIFVGALSVGIGFGLQNIVNNFISGVVILCERPIKAGDWIIINGNEGIVKDIKIRSTEMQCFDGTMVLIPNADVLSAELVNVTRKGKTGRCIVNVGVSYNSDIHLVRKILIDVAKAHPHVVKDPEPFVLLTEFGDSSINFELRCVVDDVMSRLGVRSELMFAIHDAFDKKGVEIPFPQVVVHKGEQKA